MTVISNSNPLGYDGVRAPTPPNLIVGGADPTSAQFHFPLGTLWLTKSDGDLFYLASVAANTATWTLISLAAGTVDTLTGDSGGALSPTAGNINILGGTGISVAGSGSTLTINSVGEGEKTVTATVAQQMAPNTAYFVPQQALTTLTLPLNASTSLGDVVTVYGVSTNFFTIAQNANQQMNIATVSTTAGVTGSFTSKETFDSITLKFGGVIAGTGQWVATAVSGTYTKA
jgi:hypothetical protein